MMMVRRNPISQGLPISQMFWICSKDSARSGTVAAEEFYVGQMLRGWYLDAEGFIVWTWKAEFLAVSQGKCCY